jgi:hypothetical protein
VTSPLDNLVRAGHIHAEPSDREEFEGLVRSGRLRLADAAKMDISMEGRFDLAYNASHALCLAALRYAGYRSSNRYMVFQTIPHTLSLGSAVWRVLAKCHDVRNTGEYEGFLNVDERLIADLIAATQAVLSAIDRLPAIPREK